VRLLLDTHVVLCWLGDSEQLTPRVRRAISEASNEVWVSAVSIAEIAIKQSVGKFALPQTWPDAIEAGGFDELPLAWQHAHVLSSLPRHHRDPFDRLLIAQAIAEDLTLVSADPAIARYDVRMLDWSGTLDSVARRAGGAPATAAVRSVPVAEPHPPS